MTRRGGRVPLAVLLLLFVSAYNASAASLEADPSRPRAGVRAAEVSGPVEGGNGQATAAVQDLAEVGYTESEFFYGGRATSYLPSGDQGADGIWNVRRGDTAEFQSRMIVRRPQDPARFSGTVVVEWLNVTVGRDGDPSWLYTAAEITREGHAWVGVSAQAVGVASLTQTDPPRYASLTHPGDDYSFDIFTQAVRALTDNTGVSPLGDLEPEALIAIGESQSASYLTTYINGVHPLVHVFDGFLVHSRLGATPPFTSTLPVRRALSPRIRADLDQPTLIFVTETDLTVLGYAGARQPDSNRVRTWEVAGTAHGDAWLLTQARGGGLACTGRINEGPHHQTVRAALHRLVAWVTTDRKPPVAPRLELATAPRPGQAAVIKRDAYGNAVGGIRTPFVDVPISALSGEPVPGSVRPCALFGTTTPFDAATLAQLYPDRESYVRTYKSATEAAVAAGFILPPEANAMIAIAEQDAIATPG